MVEPRFVEVEVDECEIAPDGIQLRFRAIGEDREVTEVRVDDGAAAKVWSVDEHGMRGVALAAEVEDSSEGVATLVRGGKGGIWLERDGAGWAEAYLVVARG